MKKILFLLTLFPFLHGTSYPVTFVSCKQDEIVVRYEEQDMQVSLFNIKIDESAGWNKTCDLLQQASQIKMEIDPSSAINEPVPVYLFADDTLLQSALLKEDLAFIQIKNPEYTYEKQMEEAINATEVVAQPKEQTKKTSYAKTAPLYVLGAIVVWMGMWYVWLRKKKQQNK